MVLNLSLTILNISTVVVRFCSSHGKHRSSSSPPPADALYMAEAVIPHLFNRLYKEVEPRQNSGIDVECPYSICINSNAYNE